MEDWKQASDEDLLKFWFLGEAGAFDEFFSRHAGRVAAYARRFGLAHEADDITQNVFLRLHKNIRSYDPTRPALPWFFTIVHSVCVDGYRAAKKRGIAAQEDLDHLPARPPEPQGMDEDLGKGLESLRPEQKELITMRVTEELSFREISQRTGKTEVSLRKFYQRTIEQLRALLLQGGAK